MSKQASSEKYSPSCFLGSTASRCSNTTHTPVAYFRPWLSEKRQLYSAELEHQHTHAVSTVNTPGTGGLGSGEWKAARWFRWLHRACILQLVSVSWQPAKAVICCAGWAGPNCGQLQSPYVLEERARGRERGGRSAARLWQSGAETSQSNRSGRRKVRDEQRRMVSPFPSWTRSVRGATGWTRGWRCSTWLWHLNEWLI